MTTSHLQASELRTVRVANEARNCKADGCDALRAGISPYCRHHCNAFRKYGHPLAKPYLRREWDQERKEVRDLFQGHPDHPGLLSCLKWASRWFAEADETAGKGGRKGPPAWSLEVSNVSRSGCSPLDLITEVAAFGVWESRHPYAMPDFKAWTYGTGRAVIGLAPRPRRAYRPTSRASKSTRGAATYPIKATPSALEVIGATIRRDLSPFILTVCRAVSGREEQKAQVLASMQMDFIAPSTALIKEGLQDPASP